MVRVFGLAIRLNSQKGVTIIELLVAMAIISVIGGLVTPLFSQTLVLHAESSNRMKAVKQVEKALHYLNRDIQMTSPLQSQIPTSSAFPLTLKWTDYQDNNNEHVVTYYISDGILYRSETVAGTTQSVMVIASNIDSANTRYTYNGEKVTINITVTVTGFRSATETRIFEVKLRPSS